MTKRSHKRMDPDIKALYAASRALDGSSSERMLWANLRFLWSTYERPSDALKQHWAEKEKTAGRRK